MLCKFTSFSFMATLHWPAGAEDMELFGVSFLEVLILFEQWTRHQLLSEKVTHVRANRHISISSMTVSEGIEIRQGCQFYQQSG